MVGTQAASIPGGTYEIQGQTVTMPVAVRDARAAAVTYMVALPAAQTLLPGDAYEVVEMAPGQGQLVLGFVDYRDNDLGSYKEVMIVFFVRPKGAPPETTGTFIYKLPVTESFTCEAGCKIWGFPKTIEEIGITYTDESAACRLVMGEQHVFTLSVPRAGSDAGDAPDVEMTTYSYVDGPVAVPFTSGGRGAAIIAGAQGVELTLGSHPIADELRGLGLPTSPVMSMWTEHMRGSFGAPRKL